MTSVDSRESMKTNSRRKENEGKKRTQALALEQLISTMQLHFLLTGYELAWVSQNSTALQSYTQSD